MTKGIIIASFGTTHADTRKKSIEAIENRVRKTHNEALVLRAFTSSVVIRILKNRDKISVDSLSEALDKMISQRVKEIFIQPLLIMEGVEYEKILSEVRKFLIKNDCSIKVGKPLLSSDQDFLDLISALNINSQEPTVFMGHGSYHKNDKVYQKLEDTIREGGNKTSFIATVEGEKNIGDIVVKLKEEKIDRVSLKPLMLVAGDHAKNDMASDEEGSWKQILEKNGIEVSVVLQGLGENQAVQDIFLAHLERIII